MAKDMRIEPVQGEKPSEYNCRVMYSALGLWCLSMSENQCNGITGVTKQQHSISLGTLMEHYSLIEPKLAEYLKSPKTGEKFSARMRSLYENTGYFVTDGSNKNRLASFGEHVSTGANIDLYIGIPEANTMELNGLGVFSRKLSGAISVNEFIMRDNMMNEDYIKSQYNICDFENRDIDKDELEFFDPLMKNAPSQSWGKKMKTEFSIARKGVYGPYYRVIRDDNEILYCEQNEPGVGLYAEEFRRLYFALRRYYGNPQPVWVSSKDKQHVELQLSAKLPGREYSLMLLSAWPIGNAFNSQRYLLRKDLLPMITAAMSNIGVQVKEF